nr:MAG TPA: hypothetical protein [Caudoviricetes sp.]
MSLQILSRIVNFIKILLASMPQHNIGRMNQIGHTVNHNLKLVAFIVAPAFDIALDNRSVWHFQLCPVVFISQIDDLLIASGHQQSACQYGHYANNNFFHARSLLLIKCLLFAVPSLRNSRHFFSLPCQCIRSKTLPQRIVSVHHFSFANHISAFLCHSFALLFDSVLHHAAASLSS